MQQRSHQHEGAAPERQRSGGALGSSGGHLPPTHPALPGVVQLDIPRRQLRGDALDRPQTQTGEIGRGVAHLLRKVRTVAQIRPCLTQVFYLWVLPATLQQHTVIT